MGFFSENQKTEPAAQGGIPSVEGAGTLTAKLEEKRRGRGRPPKSGSGARPQDLSDGLYKDSQRELEELYKGENWEEIAALPFNIRRAMTGSDIFTLSKHQKTILGSSLAASMKLLGLINPKYVAFTILAVNMVTIFAEKEILYRLSLVATEPLKPAA